ncbi:MAG: ABC transporter ATP-binding protein/permease [Acholeplasmatales bacterium]|nr:ABC transporter ATP-binding protein/permease [Acholeplasmatales bacterium]
MLFGKYVNKYYKKYFILFFLGALFLILVDYFQLIVPEIYGKIINGLKDNTLIIDGNYSTIFKYALQLLGIGAIMFIGRFGWRNTVFGCGIRIEADIRDELYLKALQLDQEFYKENKTGGLMAYFTNDLEVIQRCFGQGTILIVDALFLGILAYIKMVRLSYKIALLALIPLLIILFGSFFVEKLMAKRFDKKQKAYENLSDFANENFSGISVIKAFVKEDNEKKRFSNINEDNKKVNLNFVKISILVDVLFTFLLNGVVALLIYFSSDAVLNKVKTLTGETFDVGNMSELVSYFETLIWPMFAISMLINLRAQGNASLKRITKILDEPIRIKDSEDVIKDSIIDGDILFKNFSFNYPDSKIDVLHDINLHIKKGEFVGIIGRTGSGKSTIVDILLRTYNLNNNELFFDNVDIMKLPVKKVRDSIGYVPQDNFLFSDSISNNISFAYDEPDMKRIIDAAKLSDVHDNIVDFKDQYKTILGERGVTLSGGQKQRVAIARALIKNPDILILDDSVSAVDTQTEEEILKNLREVRKGKTTIIIAHRISTVKDLDKIVVLDKGTISGVGTNEELLLSNLEYQELVKLQSLEKEVEGGTSDGE